ncbi:MAG: hypothetical protein OEX22_08125, partial [Cyclobacteriaceae bacterium]|nr:hypothetical protein [Cyclobacteriaceae bacterium]
MNINKTTYTYTMQYFQTTRIKKLFLFSAFLFFSSIAFAQNNSVAIGSATVKNNAVLWLNGDGSQGLLLPTVVATGDIVSPDAGMIVYQTSDNKIYYRNASAWVEVGGTGGGGDSYSLRLQGSNLELLINGGVQDQIALSTFPVGGDISGDITSATLVSIQGAAIPSGVPSSADQILVYNGTSWVYQLLPSGTFTGVITDGTTITGDGLTTNLSVNAGTAANQIVQIDGTGKLPAIDGSQLTNLPAGTETDPIVTAISGLVKSDGTTISAAVAGTDYVATETDPTVKAITGIVKSDGTTISAATAGTDYLAPNGDGSQLTNLPAG